MFDINSIWIALFGATAGQAEEEERREREECASQVPSVFDLDKEEEKPFLQRLEEDLEHAKEQASRKWYDNEREQLEWEMQNAEFYGYDKEDIQNRMDYLDEQESKESWS